MPLTVKEFCHARGISRMTFYRWLKRGRVPNVVRDGKHWKVLDCVTPQGKPCINQPHHA